MTETVRKRTGTGSTPRIIATLRLPAHLQEPIMAYAEWRGISRNAALVELIEQGLMLSVADQSSANATTGEETRDGHAYHAVEI